MSRRRAFAWAGAMVGLAAVVGLLVWVVGPGGAPAPPGPEPGRTLYRKHCTSCHGEDGRGRSWRARLLFLRPGDLASAGAASLPESYQGAIVRHGGASFGKPGMPSFGFVLAPAEIEALIRYLRLLPQAAGSV